MLLRSPLEDERKSGRIGDAFSGNRLELSTLRETPAAVCPGTLK
jgi:hypothetical protein